MKPNMEQIKNIIFDVGDVLLSYRWKYMLMDYGLLDFLIRTRKKFLTMDSRRPSIVYSTRFSVP